MAIGGPLGPGWRQAADVRWYAPELHPAAPALPPAPAPPGWASPPPPGAGYPPGYGYAPPAPKKMPTWAVVVLGTVGGLFGLAVLAAIAIPTFLGVSNGAADRIAQSNLNVTVVDAKTAYATDRLFPPDMVYQLGQANPALNFLSATIPATSPGTVSVATVPQAILLTTRSTSGTCWWVLAVMSEPAGIGHGLPTTQGLHYARSTGGSCQASEFPVTGWQADGFPSA